MRMDEEQAVYGPESTRHSKRAPATFEVNRKEGTEYTTPLGPSVMVVSGAATIEKVALTIALSLRALSLAIA